jgi:hypothetical protein
MITPLIALLILSPPPLAEVTLADGVQGVILHKGRVIARTGAGYKAFSLPKLKPLKGPASRVGSAPLKGDLTAGKLTARCVGQGAKLSFYASSDQVFVETAKGTFKLGISGVTKAHGDRK